MCLFIYLSMSDELSAAYHALCNIANGIYAHANLLWINHCRGNYYHKIRNATLCPSIYCKLFSLSLSYRLNEFFGTCNSVILCKRVIRMAPFHIYFFFAMILLSF